jgi:hypothetical protein
VNLALLFRRGMGHDKDLDAGAAYGIADGP